MWVVGGIGRQTLNFRSHMELVPLIYGHGFKISWDLGGGGQVVREDYRII